MPSSAGTGRVGQNGYAKGMVEPVNSMISCGDSAVRVCVSSIRDITGVDVSYPVPEPGTRGELSCLCAACVCW